MGWKPKWKEMTMAFYRAMVKADARNKRELNATIGFQDELIKAQTEENSKLKRDIEKLKDELAQYKRCKELSCLVDKCRQCERYQKQIAQLTEELQSGKNGADDGANCCDGSDNA